MSIAELLVMGVYVACVGVLVWALLRQQRPPAPQPRRRIVPTPVPDLSGAAAAVRGNLIAGRTR